MKSPYDPASLVTDIEEYAKGLRDILNTGDRMLDCQDDLIRARNIIQRIVDNEPQGTPRAAQSLASSS